MSDLGSSAMVTTKESCDCWKFHCECDPATCSEASHSLFKAKSEDNSFKSPWIQFVDAADTECPTCQTIRIGIDAFGEPTHTETGDTVFVRKDSVRGKFFVELLQTKFEFIQTELTGCNAFPVSEAVSGSTRTSTTFDCCRNWIQDCVESHDICHVKSSALPHRLVEIEQNGEETFSLRLYQSHNEFGDYAALSHCWGSIPMMQTTNATLSERKRSIPWAMLSKTFQDAIIVTYELGLRYIWIDSLCIIQDDNSDWEKESEKMASVYGNSKVTIAAAKAKDGYGGCFNEEDKVVFFKRPNSGNSMAIRKYNDHQEYRHYLSEENRQVLPLFTRAWTLQEELLAPRVLYYGPMEVVFQCRTLADCQCGGINDSSNADTVKRRYEESLESSDSSHILKNWASIICQYSSRRLKHETDRLPALSGLAKSFMRPHLGAFMAGLWEKDLHLSLTWFSEVPKQARSRVYVAPSWSWASTGGEISYSTIGAVFADPANYQSCLTILDFACELSGSDPTGAMASGYLTVRGRANHAQLKLVSTTGEESLIQIGSWEVAVALDFIPHILKIDDPSSTLTVDCLLVCSSLNSYGDVYCFILILIPGERAGLYERCGITRQTFLYLTEDCERSSQYRPGLDIDRQKDLLHNVKTRPVLEWFKDVEEQKMTLV